MSFYYDPPSWNLCLPHTYFTVDRCLANPSNLSKNPLKRLQRGSFYTNQLKITLAGALRDLKKKKKRFICANAKRKTGACGQTIFFWWHKKFKFKRIMPRAPHAEPLYLLVVSVCPAADIRCTNTTKVLIFIIRQKLTCVL